MKCGENITKHDLLCYIKDLKMVFDSVRMVDPYGLQVLGDDLKASNPNNACYKVWSRNLRCSNCISLKAHIDFRRKIKYEFEGDNAFFVVAMPFRLVDENNRIVVVEMMNDVSEEMQVRTVGREIVAKTMNEIDHKLYMDSLTRTFNRRYFDDHMFIYQTKRALSRKIGFIVWDVRKFKEINDTYGHAGGDKVLRKVAEIMLLNTRDDEAVIRIGGDEFLIIVQGCSEEDLRRMIERIREKIENMNMPEMPGHCFKINVGYSYTDGFDMSCEMIQDMMRTADQQMYKDKVESYRDDLEEAVV